MERDTEIKIIFAYVGSLVTILVCTKIVKIERHAEHEPTHLQFRMDK